MDESTVTSLRQQAEPLAALSSTHLTPATRLKLIANATSQSTPIPPHMAALSMSVHRATTSRRKPTWRPSLKWQNGPVSSG